MFGKGGNPVNSDRVTQRLAEQKAARETQARKPEPKAQTRAAAAPDRRARPDTSRIDKGVVRKGGSG